MSTIFYVTYVWKKVIYNLYLVFVYGNLNVYIAALYVILYIKIHMLHLLKQCAIEMKNVLLSIDLCFQSNAAGVVSSCSLVVNMLPHGNTMTSLVLYMCSGLLFCRLWRRVIVIYLQKMFCLFFTCKKICFF